MLARGTLLDRYRLEESLGEGGMGRVYRAFDERLQRYVALKVLHVGTVESGGLTTANGGARVLREARAAAALDHPNAVAIFDVGEAKVVGEEAPVPFIAMELIEGQSLRAFIGASAVTLGDKLRWLTDIARAVAAAHARGLVHRDIKPENVMIRRDGVVKVLDFGIARRTPSGKVDAGAATQARAMLDTFTADGVVVGTPFYMAPEQMRGDAVTGKADQFSWGVVAYELLSGTLPWDREGDPLKIVSEVLTRHPPSLRLAVPEVPAIVDAAILRALAKDPAERLASMDGLVATLETSTLGSARALPPAVAAALGSAPTVQSTRTSLASAAALASHRGARSRRARWPVGFGLAIAAVALVAAAALRLGPRTHAASVADAHATPTPTPTPTSVLDLPAPSTNPEALAAYQNSMTARRSGDGGRFIGEALRAITLDPKLAPALMRLGIRLFDVTPEQAREYFSRAVEQRDSLTPRDREFLDAFVPYVQRDPSDLAETRARLRSLAARYPMDAEVAFALARQDEKAGDVDRALAGYRHAREIDPGFVVALLAETNLLAATKGDYETALAESDVCEQVAPGDPGCFIVRDEIYTRRGQCSELEKDARRLIAQRPSSDYGYMLAAEALSGLGGATPSVSELITQARARMNKEGKEWIPAALFDVHFAELEGDFTRADALMRAREDAVASASAEDVHGSNAWDRAQMAIESGKPEVARAVAKDFFRRRGAWTKPPSRVTDLIAFDYALPLLATLGRADGGGPDALDSQRAEWLQRWQDVPDAAPYVWFGAYAEEVATVADAQAAMAALPRFQPFPHLWHFATEFPIGKTYLLAGRIDEAIPYLRLGAASCDALDFPFDHVRASLYLGQALETKNDTPGACAAYRFVLSRWGSAKPRSVTADAARARLAALHCAP
jgi:serine/threonine-protein kinase